MTSLCVIVLLAPSHAFTASSPDCRSRPYVSATCRSFRAAGRCHPMRPAPCFWVTGRLTFGNGTPGVRLWPRETRRVLGVHGGDGDPESPGLLPKNVETLSRPPN